MGFPFRPDAVVAAVAVQAAGALAPSILGEPVGVPSGGVSLILPGVWRVQLSSPPAPADILIQATIRRGQAQRAFVQTFYDPALGIVDLIVSEAAPAGGGGFGSGFATGAAPNFPTSNAAMTPVGASITGLVGPVFILATGLLSTDNVANGGRAGILKNGAQIGQFLSIAPGAHFPPGSQESWAEQVVDGAIATDVYEIAISAVPGGGADSTTIAGPRITGWQTTAGGGGGGTAFAAFDGVIDLQIIRTGADA